MRRRDFLASLAASTLLPEALAAAGARSADASSGPSARREGPYALVLGSVQDGGFPQAGCYTGLCDHGRELHRGGRGRFVTSLALVEPEAERFWLVDATPDITRQMDLIEEPSFRRRAGERRPFDGIFLTHAHIGHYLGLALLGNEGLGIRDTPVYCTESMAAFLEGNAPWNLMIRQERIRPMPRATDAWHRISDALEVRLLEVPHRNEFADTVALHIRGPWASLLYIPDIDAWERWERDLAREVESVDVALLDASFWSLDELPGRPVEEVPHPLATRTMDLLQDVADRRGTRIVLTHLNNSNPALLEDGPQAAEVARRGFEIAREGMSFAL
jgi:pyrroloquinoline quinone biosynthesis protein B